MKKIKGKSVYVTVQGICFEVFYIWSGDDTEIAYITIDGVDCEWCLNDVAIDEIANEFYETIKTEVA
jgi:hypothetical protein